MIKLSNGYEFEYMTASGALGFGYKGWPHEWPLRWVGLLDPKLFAVVAKTIKRYPQKGNLRWWQPWTCIKRISPGSWINKVGLTNPGIEVWLKKWGRNFDSKKVAVMASIQGSTGELLQMAVMLDEVDVVAIKVNASCPNTGHPFSNTDDIIRGIKLVRSVSKHPIIIKVSAAQDVIAIAKGLAGIAEAMAWNSVPWEMVKPGERSPLRKLEQRVKGGEGGVSGLMAQSYNWSSMKKVIKEVPDMPVIAPDIMSREDIGKVRALGAKAVSFGCIHLEAPWAPTKWVRELNRQQK